VKHARKLKRNYTSVSFIDWDVFNTRLRSLFPFFFLLLYLSLSSPSYVWYVLILSGLQDQSLGDLFYLVTCAVRRNGKEMVSIAAEQRTSKTH